MGLESENKVIQSIQYIPFNDNNKGFFRMKVGWQSNLIPDTWYIYFATKKFSIS